MLDLSVPAQKGILPASGSSMLALSPMMVDMEAQTAEVIETIQVLDVRKMLQPYKNQSGSTLLSASVKFNQTLKVETKARWASTRLGQYSGVGYKLF